MMVRNRRDFLKKMVYSAGGLALGPNVFRNNLLAKQQADIESRISFVTGTDRQEMIYSVLQPFENEIETAIANKQIIIKPNNVTAQIPLCATHVDAVRGILEFLKPLTDQKIIIAESTAAGAQSTFVGFENYGYLPLSKEYNVKLIDLNDQPSTLRWIMGENFHPLPINIINTYLDPDIFIISATRLKTHDNIFATLSLKNIVMGAPVNHYRQKSREGRNEKPKMHSGGNRGRT